MRRNMLKFWRIQKLWRVDGNRMRRTQEIDVVHMEPSVLFMFATPFAKPRRGRSSSRAKRRRAILRANVADENAFLHRY